MIIPIDEEWRIKTDKYQWICQKMSAKKDGEIDWKSESYHPTLKNAINSLAERLLRESDATGMNEAIVAAESISQTLKSALMQ